MMESHDLPGRGSAKCRVLSAAALVSFALSSVQIILLHDGSSPHPSPCSQYSITARRRLSSDWCCFSISANTPIGISLSPSVLQATPGRNFKMPSTVRGGTEEKERKRGGGGQSGNRSHVNSTWMISSLVPKLSTMELTIQCHAVPMHMDLLLQISTYSCAHLVQHSTASQSREM